MKIFYHKSDLDGKCSAAIVKYDHKEDEDTCELIGVDYDTPIDLDSIAKNEKVFMVDFSAPTEIMLGLQDKANFVWIDHHVSAIERCKKAAEFWEGLQEVGKAGCELTWAYCFGLEHTPEAVHYLGRYDVWDHKDKNVLKFQCGMRAQNCDPDNDSLWHSLFEGGKIIKKILYDGDAIMKYIDNDNEIYSKTLSFETELCGYKALAINKALTNSKLFDAVYDPNKHDILVPFSYDGKKWKFSIYTRKEDIDCSKIAESFGGGGHKKAAGFSLDHLPF